MSISTLSPADTATEALAALKATNPTLDSEDWSEADTRSKLIDVLLKGCLLWRETDIRRELAANRLRLDYVLSLTRPVLVVEAKKAGIDFPVNKTGQGMTRCSISAMLRGNPSLKEHMQQAAAYCSNWSVPFAVLTNGRTLIAFVAVRTDGVPWQDGQALVCPDVLSEHCDFARAFNLLSRPAFEEGQLGEELLSRPALKTPEVPLSRLPDPDRRCIPNDIGLAMEPVLRAVFSDASRDDSREVIANCYVQPGSSTLMNVTFEALLLSRPPTYAGSVIAVDCRNAYVQFQDTVASYLKESEDGRTLLIIGRVGVGKTMFLQRYFRYGPDSARHTQDATVFFLDFRKPGVDPTAIETLIYDRLREQIEAMDGEPVPGDRKSRSYDFSSDDAIKQMFWAKYSLWQRGPVSRLKGVDDKEYLKERTAFFSALCKNDKAYVRAACRRLQKHYGRLVAVILDNTDQCTEDYQNAVYLYSKTMENDLKCLIVVALREEWYWFFSRREGPFSAYHDTVFHIPPPRSRDVLAKRLDYALEIADAMLPRSVRTHLPSGIELTVEHLGSYLRACRRAFLEDEENAVFFECMSNGDVRRGLDAFIEFLRSGHTHVDEYLRAFVLGKQYTIRFHQLFKSIALGANAFYSSKRPSKVPNVLKPMWNEKATMVSYCARVYLLRMLAKNDKRESSAGRGFLPIGEVAEFLGNMGLTRSMLEELIVELWQGKLLEMDVNLALGLENWQLCRATAYGKYAVEWMTADFAYLEHMMIDTPIGSDSLVEEIAGVYGTRRKPPLANRLATCEKFVDYLESTEKAERQRLESAGVGMACGPYFPKMRARAQPSFRRVRDALSRRSPGGNP